MWFGRIWLLKPLIIATLSIFWLLSGIIAVLRWDVAVAILTDRGVGNGLAKLTVGLGSMVDVALGMGIAFAKCTRIAAVGMATVSLAYLAGSLVFAPDIWLDPLGPMIKVLPGILLAFTAAAISDSR